MCGIAGIIMRDPERPADGRAAVAMADSMFHRGPDGDGLWVQGSAALAHRRLSIIDLSEKARQPMSTPDGRYVITFNGEIYNYRELRKDLEAAGVAFRSSSDTEVLLRAFERRGADILRDLNGIFAFAIWDRRERVLFGARDQLGVKPFYYVDSPDRFLFASEIKALLAAGHRAELVPERIPEQLAFGAITGEATLFKGVRRLPPGAYIQVPPGQAPRVQRYFDLGRDRRVLTAADARDYTALVRQTLEQAVRRQMVSDVPVGSLCSGGLDSSGVTAISAELSRGINTFCVKVAEVGLDETPYSRQVSEACHTAHHELETRSPDIPELLATTVWLSDEPLKHPHSIPLFQISRLARQTVTVLLCGEGADELFGGYTVHRRTPMVYAAQRYVPWPLLSVGQMLSARFGWRGGERVAEAALAMDRDRLLVGMRRSTAEGEIAGLVPGFVQELSAREALAHQSWDQSEEEPVQAALLYDQRVYLPTLLDRQDKLCMGTSIESRVPFLDMEVLKLANALPVDQKIRGGEDKVVLREALLPRLPPSIANRAKMGFGLPFTMWLRKSAELKDMVTRLSQGELVRSGLVDRPALDRTVKRALQGDERISELTWNLLNLETWWGLFLSGTTKPDLGQLPAHRARSGRPAIPSVA